MVRIMSWKSLYIFKAWKCPYFGFCESYLDQNGSLNVDKVLVLLKVHRFVIFVFFEKVHFWFRLMYGNHANIMYIAQSNEQL